MVKVAFLHPDLGIGGAERLVVDAAVALQVALSTRPFTLIPPSRPYKNKAQQANDGSLGILSTSRTFSNVKFGLPR